VPGVWPVPVASGLVPAGLLVGCGGSDAEPHWGGEVCAERSKTGGIGTPDVVSGVGGEPGGEVGGAAVIKQRFCQGRRCRKLRAF
jgi:hypothetical protein